MKNVVKKSKKTAIILAVIFGIFSWIYTYKYNAWKFWISLIFFFMFNFELFISVALYTWVIIDVCLSKKDMYENY